MLDDEKQELIKFIEQQARDLEMLAGNSFHYGQFIGLLRCANMIEKGFHEDFSDPRLSGEARHADGSSKLGRKSNM